MASASAPKFMSQAEFAKRRKVSRKSVTIWKQRGLVVLTPDGQVDVEATEWKLDERPAKYRGGVTHRPVRAPGGNKPSASGKAKQKPNGASTQPAGEETLPPDIDLSGENLPLPDAIRRKENFLGLLRKRELEISNQEWVRTEDVGKLVEREYSVVRERLLAIPGKLAAKLVDRDRPAIELALFEEISEALNELHDPDRTDGRDGSASGEAS